MGNVDGGFTDSDYLYKDKNNPLIYMGPIWDFDISSGNVDYETIINPTVPWIQPAAWYARWFEDPGFKADAATQWNALKNNGVFKAWLASINQEAVALQQSQANNFGRWPMQGIEVWPNPQAAGSYSGEVAYLIDWINLRIGYLDSIFNSKAQTTTTLTVPSGTLRESSPVTLSAHVTGATAPTGNVTFLSSYVVVGIGVQSAKVLGAGTLDGNGDATLTISNLPEGSYSLEAVYNGDNTNALSISSSTPVTVLGPLLNTVTTLTSSVSSVNPQTPTTLTVLVIGNSGTTTPTGTVTFTANGQLLGTAALTPSGSATFAPVDLPSGVDSLQAAYSGDSTYQSSSSNIASVAVAAVEMPVFSLATGTYTTAQTVTITDGTPGAAIYYTIDGTTPTATSTMYSGPITISSTETLEAIAVVANYAPSGIETATYTIPPNYTLLATPSSLSITQGGTGNTVLTVTPVGNYTGTLTFSCSNLPAHAVCMFAQNSIQLTGNNQPANVGLTIQTNVQQARMETIQEPTPSPYGPILPVMAFWWPGSLTGLMAFRRKRKLPMHRLLMLCLLLAAVGGLAVSLLGCGGSSRYITPAGTTTVAVTATATSGGTLTTETLNIVVTVDQ